MRSCSYETPCTCRSSCWPPRLPSALPSLHLAVSPEESAFLGCWPAAGGGGRGKVERCVSGSAFPRTSSAGNSGVARRPYWSQETYLQSMTRGQPGRELRGEAVTAEGAPRARSWRSPGVSVSRKPAVSPRPVLVGPGGRWGLGAGYPVSPSCRPALPRRAAASKGTPGSSSHFVFGSAEPTHNRTKLEMP